MGLTNNNTNMPYFNNTQVLAMNLNSTNNLIQPYANFTINGTSIVVISIMNRLTASLTKMPASYTMIPEADDRTNGLPGYLRRFNDLLSNRIVIVLSKQASLQAERELISDLLMKSNVNGLGVDIVLTSWNTEMLRGTSGCAPGITCVGDYPAIGSDGTHPIIIAAAPPLGTGIGVLNVTFDDAGNLIGYQGDVVLFNRTRYPPDPVSERDIADREAEMIDFSSRVVGETPITLIGRTDPCRAGQCSFGSLVADAMREASGADFAWVGGGSLRADIPQGNFTYGHILSALPFSNSLTYFEVKGDTLLALLNNGFSRYGAKTGTARFPQISGGKVSFNPNLPPASRLIDAQILKRGKYSDLDTRETYKVATTDFNFLGGDGYGAILTPGSYLNVYRQGNQIVQIATEFINQKASNDSQYYSSLANPGRIVSTERTEAFVPTSRPFVPKPIPDGIIVAFTIITGVLAIFTILIGAFIWYRRDHAVTVIASPVFCMIIIFGVLLALLAVMIYMHVFNNGGCMAFPWLGNYAFVIIFGALFAKTWRVDMIFSRTKKLRTKRRAISNVLLFAVIGILLLIETFIMGLWQGLSPLKYVNHFNNDNFTSQFYCSSKNGIYFFAASIAYKGLLMLWGMYLVIKTRNIDSDFRESTFIGWVIFAVFFTCAVVVTICLILKSNLIAVFVLVHIGFWLVTCAVIGAIFLPKVIEIISHPGLVWSVYFQRRAENMRNGTGSVFNKNTSVSHDSIHDRMDGMSLTALQSLLEEYELREKSLNQSVRQVQKDLTAIRAKIAKKEGSAPPSSPPKKTGMRK